MMAHQAAAFAGLCLLLCPVRVPSMRVANNDASTGGLASGSFSEAYELYDQAVTKASQLLIRAEDLDGHDANGLARTQRDIDVALDEAESSLQAARRREAQRGGGSPGALLEEQAEEGQGGGPLDRTLVGMINPWEWTRYMSSAPAEGDVQALQGWGAELGIEAVESIRGLGFPASDFYEAARAKYKSAEERDDMALHNLLALHFKKRMGFKVSHSSRQQIFAELASDSVELHSQKQRLQWDGEFGNYSSTTSPLGPGIQAYFQGVSAARGRKKPTALIFTCSFGGGHKSAAEAIIGYLSELGYDAKMIDTTRDPKFTSMDQRLADIVFNKVVLQRQWYRLFNIIDQGQVMAGGILTKECPSPECDTTRKQRFRNAILANHPDLVITVYHMEVLLVMELAKELGNLPYVHIATDIDVKMREVFEVSRPPVYPRMLVGIPFDIEKSKETVVPLKPWQIFLAGYPVRPPFLKASDAALVQKTKEAHYPAGCRFILVMSGGGGQKTPWPAMLGDYGLAEEQPERPIHVVVIAGSDTTVEPDLQERLPGRVKFPPGDTAFDSQATSNNDSQTPKNQATFSTNTALSDIDDFHSSLESQPSELSLDSHDSFHSQSDDDFHEAGNISDEEWAHYLGLDNDPEAESFLEQRISESIPKLPMSVGGELRRSKYIIRGRVLLQGEAKHVTVEVARGGVPEKPFFIGGEELSLLMDMADLVITKPGGGSTAELAYRGPPAVFDASHSLLHWERFTALRFEELKRGLRVSREDVDHFQSICKEAMSYGRSTFVAEEEAADGTRKLINPVEKLKAAIDTLSRRPCDGCTAF